MRPPVEHFTTENTETTREHCDRANKYVNDEQDRLGIKYAESDPEYHRLCADAYLETLSL